MRIRGFGAARIYDAAGGVPASLRELRIVVHQLWVDSVSSWSSALAAPKGAFCSLSDAASPLPCQSRISRMHALRSRPLFPPRRLNPEPGCLWPPAASPHPAGPSGLPAAPGPAAPAIASWPASPDHTTSPCTCVKAPARSRPAPARGGRRRTAAVNPPETSPATGTQPSAGGRAPTPPAPRQNQPLPAKTGQTSRSAAGVLVLQP